MAQQLKVLAGNPDDLNLNLWNPHSGKRELTLTGCLLISTLMTGMYPRALTCKYMRYKI